jgi:hypothetical protein
MTQRTWMLAVAITAVLLLCAAAAAADGKTSEERATDAFLTDAYRRDKWRSERKAGKSADEPQRRTATAFKCPKGHKQCTIEFDQPSTSGT